MWNYASKALAGSVKIKPSHADPECSDDEASPCRNKEEEEEEGFECPICFESFNIVENIPYVLWCGHTLCKNCVMGLQWAVVNFPNLPVQLPLFIACPWCQLLSFRLVYKGVLKFPRKNFFLLWMVEKMNGEGVVRSSARASRDAVSHVRGGGSDTELRGMRVRRWLVFLVHLPAKFSLVIVFVLVAMYAVPASAVILVLYVLLTVLLALPSFLILYFAYPTLDWLVREIVT